MIVMVMIPMVRIRTVLIRILLIRMMKIRMMKIRMILFLPVRLVPNFRQGAIVIWNVIDFHHWIFCIYVSVIFRHKITPFPGTEL